MSNSNYRIPNGWIGRIEDATYHDQVLPIYRDNPLIEALPPIMLEEEILRRLTHIPDMDAEHRTLPWEQRVHLIQCIDGFFQPMPKHVDLCSQISTLIRKSYMARNPLQFGFWPQLNRDIDVLKEQLKITSSSRNRKSAMSMAMIGISGIGKSRALEEILLLYPQVIHHSSYRGFSFCWEQLVWLKLECPHNGSVKSLAFSFFQQIDSCLGTNYQHDYSIRRRVSKEDLLAAMARVGAIHSLGVLVIDEIQALSHTKSGGAEEMLNFFVELVNLMGLPIIMVGTYKAKSLFSQAFRQARRATSRCAVLWDRMKFDQEWAVFVETLWEYQYTKQKIELTTHNSYVLYDISQGITDIAIKVYILAQILAITTKVEQLSPALFQEAARIGLPLVQPFLDALRSNDVKELSKMEDIEPLDMTGLVDAMIDTRTAVGSAVDPIPMKGDISSTSSPSHDVANEGLLSVLKEDSAEIQVYDQLREHHYVAPVDHELGFDERSHTEDLGGQ
jgi:hypothetical protein